MKNIVCMVGGVICSLLLVASSTFADDSKNKNEEAINLLQCKKQVIFWEINYCRQRISFLTVQDKEINHQITLLKTEQIEDLKKTKTKKSKKSKKKSNKKRNR